MLIQVAYDLENGTLLFFFIIIFTALALVGLAIFELVMPEDFFANTHHRSIGVYISILSIAVAVMLAFIISDLWTTFHETESKLNMEANTLFLLHNVLGSLPGAEQSQTLLIGYICYIINIEFPSLEVGILPPEGSPIVKALTDSIYSYVPADARETVLYDKSVTLWNDALILRSDRIERSMIGLSDEIWVVIWFGVALIIIMSYFVRGDLTYRMLMTAFISAGLASLLFLAVALDYPFRGDFGLDSKPFEFVLQQIPASCPSS